MQRNGEYLEIIAQKKLGDNYEEYSLIRSIARLLSSKDSSKTEKET